MVPGPLPPGRGVKSPSPWKKNLAHTWRRKPCVVRYFCFHDDKNTSFFGIRNFLVPRPRRPGGGPDTPPLPLRGLNPLPLSLYKKNSLNTLPWGDHSQAGFFSNFAGVGSQKNNICCPLVPATDQNSQTLSTLCQNVDKMCFAHTLEGWTKLGECGGTPPWEMCDLNNWGEPHVNKKRGSLCPAINERG